MKIIDDYYKYIKDKYCCEISDELLGKKYIVGEQFGIGDFLTISIEDGLEISKCNIKKMKMELDVTEHNDDTLEVGYCYSGDTKMVSLPDHKEYILKAGDIFIYQTLNNVECFESQFRNCRTISIHMDFNAIKNVVNPKWEHRLMADWRENIYTIFKENTLIIEKASYDLRKISQEIDSISIDDMMGYMKIKLKTIEFLATFLEEKIKKNSKGLKNEEIEIITKAKEIINKRLDHTPTVKELAEQLNISIYKLQKGFKDFSGDTVYEYIKKTKMERAKYLLKNTNMSILMITNEIGYENPSKFANLFKKYNGMNPLQYRKAQNRLNK